jgi:hypothetical protein
MQGLPPGTPLENEGAEEEQERAEDEEGQENAEEVDGADEHRDDFRCGSGGRRCAQVVRPPIQRQALKLRLQSTWQICRYKLIMHTYLHEHIQGFACSAGQARSKL